MLFVLRWCSERGVREYWEGLLRQGALRLTRMQQFVDDWPILVPDDDVELIDGIPLIILDDDRLENLPKPFTGATVFEKAFEDVHGVQQMLPPPITPSIPQAESLPRDPPASCPRSPSRLQPPTPPRVLDEKDFEMIHQMLEERFGFSKRPKKIGAPPTVYEDESVDERTAHPPAATDAALHDLDPNTPTKKRKPAVIDEGAQKDFTKGPGLATAGGPGGQPVDEILVVCRNSEYPEGDPDDPRDLVQVERARLEERAQEMAKFFMDVEHKPKHQGCSCSPRITTSILIGISSNTNFGTARHKGQIFELQQKLASGTGRLVMCISGSDGLSTNLGTYEPLFKPLMAREPCLFVWEPPNQYHCFEMGKLLGEVADIQRGVVSKSFEARWLRGLSDVAGGKDLISRGLQINARVLFHGRNKKNLLAPASADEAHALKAFRDSPDQKTPEVLEWTPEAKRQRKLNGQQNSTLLRILPIVTGRDHEGLHLCPEPGCTEKFENMKAVELHVRDSIVERDLATCSLCPADRNRPFKRDANGAVNPNNVYKHVKSHLEPKATVECEICGQTLATQKTLTSHMAAIHGKAEGRSVAESPGEPVKCGQCDKVYETEAKMRRHVKGCHDPPTEICPHCGVGVRPSKSEVLRGSSR